MKHPLIKLIKPKPLAAGMLATALLLVPGLAWAELSDTWFTIDGGGGTSTGGRLALSGTAGQPDAGNMSGGGYILYGGFWGMAAGWPPRMTITYASGSVTIGWPLILRGYVLEQTDSLVNPVWTPVGLSPSQTDAVTQGITLQTGPTRKFYRLIKQ